MTLNILQFWFGAFVVMFLLAAKVHDWKWGVSLKMAFHMTNCVLLVFMLVVGIYEDTKHFFKPTKELTAHVAETPQIRTQ